MARKRLIAIACGLLATCVAAPAADKGIHIGGTSAGFPWTVTDGAGFFWDIYQTGMVHRGTYNAYRGGMDLSISGSTFPVGSTGRRSKDERESEVGPWIRGALRIWRRIYVDPKLGYCRWIDIYQNTGSSRYDVAILYYSHLGGRVQQIVTTSGKDSLTGEDWGFVSSYTGGSPLRPTMMHVYASRGAKVKPTPKWTRGNSSIYYRISLKIPARKTVALCFFEAQRRPNVKTVAMLKTFNPIRELRKVPPALRRIIVNMPSSLASLGPIDLRRNDKLDLAVLRDGTEHLGSIVMDKYVVETFYGNVELPAERVLGVFVPAASDTQVHVALTDGQIVAGKLANGPIRLKLANGKEMALAPSKLLTIAYRISKIRPQEFQPHVPMIDLRCQQRLRFNAENTEYAFHTEYGEIKLLPEYLSSILLDTPEGGLHRAIFRNGSVLSGLLVTPTLELRLQLGTTLKISRHLVREFHFAPPGKPPGEMAELTLRNENVLYGRIVEDTIRIKTKFDSPAIARDKIAELELLDGSHDRAIIKLHNGTTVRGRLIDKTIRFKIEPGPELPIFVGHITKIVCPPPGKKAPAAKVPVKKAAGPPAETRAVAERLERRKALHAELAAASNNLQALKVAAAQLSARIAKNPNDAELIKSLAKTRKLIDRTQVRIAEIRKALPVLLRK